MVGNSFLNSPTPDIVTLVPFKVSSLRFWSLANSLRAFVGDVGALQVKPHHIFQVRLGEFVCGLREVITYCLRNYGIGNDLLGFEVFHSLNLMLPPRPLKD